MDRADHELRSFTGYQLRRVSSAAMPPVNDLLEQFGLRRTSYSTLVVIVKNPGMNQGQIADALAIERPNIVQIIDRLESAGLVQRTKSPEDRRAYALRPTARGRALEVKATEALWRLEHAYTKGLTKDEVAALHRALEIIEENTKKLERDDAWNLPIS